MEPHRLKIKVGQHEFEAEGPSDVVQAQFEAWKELIAGANAEAPLNPAVLAEDRLEGPADLPSIFAHDRKKNLISLRVQPRGERRYADAVLLILHAARLLDQEEVMVGRIKEAMGVSGLRLERVDRTMEPYLKANLVLKGGTGKGGKYRLTNTGIQRAKELVQDLTS